MTNQGHPGSYNIIYNVSNRRDCSSCARPPSTVSLKLHCSHQSPGQNRSSCTSVRVILAGMMRMMANINPMTALLLLLCAQVHGTNAIMGDGAVDPLDLPLTRPPGWVYRPRSSALSTSVDVNDMGVISINVQHTPLPAVTSAMINWFLSGLGATQLRHPTDCKV